MRIFHIKSLFDSGANILLQIVGDGGYREFLCEIGMIATLIGVVHDPDEEDCFVCIKFSDLDGWNAPLMNSSRENTDHYLYLKEIGIYGFQIIYFEEYEEVDSVIKIISGKPDDFDLYCSSDTSMQYVDWREAMAREDKNLNPT